MILEEVENLAGIAFLNPKAMIKRKYPSALLMQNELGGLLFSYGEMTKQLKNTFSHRSIALGKAVDYLKSLTTAV